MSGALPSVDFTSVNIASEQKTLVSQTDSGKTFRRQVDGQKWKLTCIYKQQPRLSFQSIMVLQYL